MPHLIRHPEDFKKIKLVPYLTGQAQSVLPELKIL
jgi:hypothetical protein